MSPVVASVLTTVVIFATLGFESWRQKDDRKALEARNATIERLHTRLTDPASAAAIQLNTQQQVDLLEAQMNYEAGTRDDLIRQAAKTTPNGTAPVVREDLIGGMDPRDFEDLM